MHRELDVGVDKCRSVSWLRNICRPLSVFANKTKDARKDPNSASSHSSSGNDGAFRMPPSPAHSRVGSDGLFGACEHRAVEIVDGDDRTTVSVYLLPGGRVLGPAASTTKKGKVQEVCQLSRGPLYRTCCS